MKKCNIILLIFNLVFFSESFSQVTFSKRYNLPMTFAKMIEPAPDGGFYFCGGMNSDIVVGKIDSIGNLQWAKQIGYTGVQELPLDMVVMDNGNMVAGIRWYDGAILKTYFMSFDLSGNLVFCKRYQNATMGQVNVLNNMIKDGNGFCAAVYNYPINEVRIFKSDSDGNKTGSVYMPGSLRSIFKTSTGKYLLFAPFTPEIVLFDSSLNYLNSAYTSTMVGAGYYYGMLEISDGSYFLFGEYFDGSGILAKVNSQLEFEWQKFYDFSFPLPEGKLGSAQKISSNKIAFFGQGESWGNKPYILITDTMGNVIDCKLITTDGLNPDNCPGRTSFKDNRFTFIYNLATGVFFQDITCFKITSTDTSFSQICNAVDTTMIVSDDVINSTGNFSYTVSATNDSLVSDTLPVNNITFPYGACNDTTLGIDPVTEALNRFKVFPNPFNELLNITAESDEVSEIILFDVTGRIMTKRNFLNAVSINTGHLKKGMYLYEVRYQRGYAMKGKVVKD